MTDIPGLQDNSIPIEVPDGVRYILDTIRSNGYEAYIVGGCVRDILLGRIPDDWDITTSALPQQVKDLFPATVDTGLQHGTVMVLKGGRGYEVTTYRIDGEYKDGRHPESVTFTPSLEEDLKRRDFTINAFAYNPAEGVIDLFGGLKDLGNGVIRAVGDPRKRFEEDALRIMRAVRFSAQLSFAIEEETAAAISEFAPRLAMVSRERIRVEFEKTLFSDNPGYVNKYADFGLASYIVPEISDITFSAASEDIYDRLLKMDDTQDGGNEPEEEGEGRGISMRQKVLRLAAFFKDVPWGDARTAMRKMTFDNHSRDLVCGILRYHGQVMKSASAGTYPAGKADTERKIREDLHLAGEEVYGLCLDYLEACGCDVQLLCKALGIILERGDAYETGMLDINGNDLIEAGIPAGKQVGSVLSALLTDVIKDPSMNKKELLRQRALDILKKPFH